MADDHTPARTTGASRGLVLPLITLLVGLGLGAGGMALVGHRDRPAERTDGAVATATATVTPAPTLGAGGRVVIPETCLQIADEGHRLSGVLGDGVTAAQKLDALEMSSVMRDIGSIQSRLETLGQDCRRGAGATVTPSPDTSSTDMSSTDAPSIGTQTQGARSPEPTLETDEPSSPAG